MKRPLQVQTTKQSKEKYMQICDDFQSSNYPFDIQVMYETESDVLATFVTNYNRIYYICFAGLDTLTVVNGITKLKSEVVFESNIKQIHAATGPCQYIVIELAEGTYIFDIITMKAKQLLYQVKEHNMCSIIVCKGENGVVKPLVINKETNQIRKAMFKETDDHFSEVPIKQQSGQNINAPGQKFVYLDLQCQYYSNVQYVHVISDILIYISDNNMYFFDLKTQQNILIFAFNQVFESIPLSENEQIKITVSLYEHQFIIYSEQRIIGCILQQSHDQFDTSNIVLHIRFILSQSKVNQLIMTYIHENSQNINVEDGTLNAIYGATEFTRDQIVILMRNYICTLSQYNHKLLLLAKHEYLHNSDALVSIQNIIINKTLQCITNFELASENNEQTEQKPNLITALIVLTPQKIHQLTPTTVLDLQLKRFTSALLNNISNDQSSTDPLDEQNQSIKQIKPLCSHLVQYFSHTNDYTVIQIFNQIIFYLFRVNQLQKVVKVIQFMCDKMQINYLKYYTILMPMISKQGKLMDYISNFSIENNSATLHLITTQPGNDQTEIWSEQHKCQLNAMITIFRFILNKDESLIPLLLTKMTPFLQNIQQMIQNILEEHYCMQCKQNMQIQEYKQQQLSHTSQQDANVINFTLIEINILTFYGLIKDQVSYYQFLLTKLGIEESINFCAQSGRFNQLLDYFGHSSIQNTNYKSTIADHQYIMEQLNIQDLATEIAKAEHIKPSTLQGAFDLLLDIISIDREDIKFISGYQQGESIINYSLHKLIYMKQCNVGRVNLEDSALNTIQTLIQNGKDNILGYLQRLQKFIYYIALGCTPNNSWLIQFFINNANEIIQLYSICNVNSSFILWHITLCVFHSGKYDLYKDIIGIHYYFEQFHQYVINPVECTTDKLVYGMLYKKSNTNEPQLDMQKIIALTISAYDRSFSLCHAHKLFFNSNTIKLIIASQMPHIGYFIDEKAIDQQNLIQFCQSADQDDGQLVCALINFYYSNKDNFGLDDKYFLSCVYELLNSSSDETNSAVLHKIQPKLISQLSINDTNNSHVCLNLLINEQLQATLTDTIQNILIEQEYVSKRTRILNLQQGTRADLSFCSLCHSLIESGYQSVVIYHCGHIFHQECAGNNQECQICADF